MHLRVNGVTAPDRPPEDFRPDLPFEKLRFVISSGVAVSDLGLLCCIWDGCTYVREAFQKMCHYICKSFTAIE